MSVGIDMAWRLAKVKARQRSRLMFPPHKRERRKDWAARERLRVFMQYTMQYARTK